MLSDTHPEAAAVQLELLRKQTPDQRLATAIALTEMVRRQAKNAIALAHPEWSQRERDLFFIEVTYGKDLAERVRESLESRQP